MKWKPALSAALLVGAIAATPMTAQASSTMNSTASSSVSVGEPLAGTVVTTPSGSKVKLTKDFDKYTVSELTSIGLGPGQNPHGHNIKIQTAPIRSMASPNNASGTNGDVTIFVKGSGTQVTAWETTLNDSYQGGGTYAVFWAPTNNVYATSDYGYIPPNSNGVAYLDVVPVYFPNNTQICNSWVNFNGKPCETVHS